MNRNIINDKSVKITTEVFFLLATSVGSSFIVDDALYAVDGRIKLF